MSFFVNPHETYIFRVVKLLMLAQSFLQSFELESAREQGGKKRKQKLLCEAKTYHCKILVFIARRCLPSVAESAFFSLHSSSTHRVWIGAQGLLRGNKFDDADSAKLRAKWQLFPTEEQSFVIALAWLFFFIALAKLAIKSPHFAHQFKSYIVFTSFKVRNNEMRRCQNCRVVAVYRGN